MLFLKFIHFAYAFYLNTVVLDLDETLISSVHPSQICRCCMYNARFILDNQLLMHPRSHLQHFLEELTSLNLHIIVYTAGTRDYAMAVTKIIDKSKLIKEIYSREDCVLSNRGPNNIRYNYLVYNKDVEKHYSSTNGHCDIFLEMNKNQNGCKACLKNVFIKYNDYLILDDNLVYSGNQNSHVFKIKPNNRHHKMDKELLLILECIKLVKRGVIRKKDAINLYKNRRIGSRMALLRYLRYPLV
ncbi:hypothetical protein ECANGB1_2689 [Enterospora canceri]|uniref:Mitochondrial import inner membrane translocase subunit TIM50 n=1 Tax=Enterospora canceri TaxID=1081671 RepID=A0A1Y1S9C5_9MICR|nr:hypothetical protein ECANGB1_2689 [Enterospora canceri]